MTDFYAGKRVAITGAAGTTGAELVRQLIARDVKEIIAIDRHETNLFYLSDHYQDVPQFHPFSCDINDTRQLTRLIDGVDCVFHAAAMKHVWACEGNPGEAIQANINGVQSVIDAALDAKVGKVLFTSTDKAVNPTNVMGTSKLMGERLITSAASLRRHEEATVFASTRFGNVLGSAGSVVPLFLRQIENGGPLTVTDPNMSRFVMTLEDSISLVLKAMEQCHGGEVFVTKMPVLYVDTLARLMVDTFAPSFGYKPRDIQVRTIGKRPGEKLYEQLITEEESSRTLMTDDFLVVLPAFRAPFREVTFSYPSEQGVPETSYDSHLLPAMSEAEIREMLAAPGVLPERLRSVLRQELRGVA